MQLVNGYVMNSVIVSRDGDPPFCQISDQSYVAQLDRYAIIPLELFIEMGGTDHPAYAAAVQLRQKQTVDAYAVQLRQKQTADDAARMTDEIIAERDRTSED